MSSASLTDQRLRRWTPEVLEPFGLSRYARLFGHGVEPLTVSGAVTEKAAAETGLAAGTWSQPATPMALRWRLDLARQTKVDQRDRWHVGPQPARH